jgi:hypothetical protein
MGKDAIQVVDAEALEREIDELRLRAQRLIEELERRVRTRVDRARDTVERVEHAAPIAAVGLGAGALVAAGAGAVWAMRRRRTGWLAALSAALLTMSAVALVGRVAARALSDRIGRRELPALPEYEYGV